MWGSLWTVQITVVNQGNRLDITTGVYCSCSNEGITSGEMMLTIRGVIADWIFS